MKLNAKQLRVTPPSEAELAALVRRPIWLILDNVLDTYNIGSLFRLADAVGAMELVLCGGSETPPGSRIHKAAVGTEEWVKWRYFPTALEAIETLRKEVEGILIVAVEQNERSVSLDTADMPMPVALIVGHETDGVSQSALDVADLIVEIPMWGINTSLNVHVSAAVALQRVRI